MRLVSQPVALLACQEADDHIATCVVNTVFPISAETPSLGVSLIRNTRSCKAVLQEKRYWLSFFSSDESARMRRVAAAASYDRVYEAGLTDGCALPIMEGSAVAFECQRTDEFEAFDHFIIVGLVVGVRMGEKKCLSL